jgi:Zn-dependent protease with chaperone function
VPDAVSSLRCVSKLNVPLGSAQVGRLVRGGPNFNPHYADRLLAVRRQWEGAYLDGRSAARRRATIRLFSTGLQVTVEDGRDFQWPFQEIRQTQGFYAGEEVRLERGGPLAEALLVSDPAFLVALREVAPGAGFHDPGRRRLRAGATVGAALGLIVLTVVLYVWGIPALAAVVAARVPVGWEERLGQAAVEQLAPASRRCTDPGRQAKIDGIVARLMAPLPSRPYTIRVIVVDDRRVNALAAPGGWVVVFRGLLERAKTAEELAGVLAHEVQHVLRRHATRALIQHASMALLVSALAGDPTGALGFGVEGARALATLEYSRQFETEADAEGMQLLLAAGIDPAGMIVFFESLARTSGGMPDILSYLSTHPSPDDRLARLRALARAAPASHAPLMSAGEWRNVTAICRR